MYGHEIDAVDEPLSALNGLLGCLCCIGADNDSPTPDALSGTLHHLYFLSSEAKNKFEALAEELEPATAKVQKLSTKNARTKKI